MELEDPLELKTSEDVTGDQYIDDNLSDQDSICGDTAEEYQTVQMIEEANLSFDENFVQPNEAIPEPSWSMYPQLNLSDKIVKGKKYRLPEYTIHETPRSMSAPDVRNQEDNPSTRSGQKSRFNFLRGFLNRLQNFRNKK